jgi:hypothetical protein
MPSGLWCLLHRTVHFLVDPRHVYASLEKEEKL